MIPPKKTGSRFEWKEAYSVNNQLMDRQHHRLLDLAAKVLRSTGDPERLQFNLESLCSHTLEHFRAEERLMREYAFPGYVEHRAMHDRIMDQMYSLIAGIRDDPTSAAGIEAFVEE